jgi:hypothetical protein
MSTEIAEAQGICAKVQAVCYSWQAGYMRRITREEAGTTGKIHPVSTAMTGRQDF